MIFSVAKSSYISIAVTVPTDVVMALSAITVVTKDQYFSFLSFCCFTLDQTRLFGVNYMVSPFDSDPFNQSFGNPTEKLQEDTSEFVGNHVGNMNYPLLTL